MPGYELEDSGSIPDGSSEDMIGVKDKMGFYRRDSLQNHAYS